VKQDINTFSPLKFQAPLAAAGLTLMPYNYMKSTVFREIPGFNITSLFHMENNPLDLVSTAGLSIIMAIILSIHLAMTLSFLKDLVLWCKTAKNIKLFLEDPTKMSALFSPIISLPMSMLVLLGPLSYFVPQIDGIKQGLLPLSLLLFVFLLATACLLELRSIQLLFTKDTPLSSFNFAWLLDVLAFGALSLFGTSIAVTANSSIIAWPAGILSMFSLTIGGTLFTLKLLLLFYGVFIGSEIEAPAIQPAYFLVIPPLCLLGVSASNLISFLSKHLQMTSEILSFLVIVGAYVCAVLWLILMMFVLKSYFQSIFLKTDYSPAQWGIV